MIKLFKEKVLQPILLFFKSHWIAIILCLAGTEIILRFCHYSLIDLFPIFIFLLVYIILFMSIIGISLKIKDKWVKYFFISANGFLLLELFVLDIIAMFAELPGYLGGVVTFFLLNFWTILFYLIIFLSKKETSKNSLFIVISSIIMLNCIIIILGATRGF